jgi:hypothetical protein
MNTLRLAALAAAALFPLCAFAHQPAIPATIPPAYISECGSCHVAYPPALLSASDWQDVMRGLDKHYGDNAGLDEDIRRQIEDFLVRNAEPHWQAHFPSGNPPRLTTTIWYRVHHLELPDDIWSDKRVGSPSNCAACHAKAERLLFDKRDMTKVPAEFGLPKERQSVYPP